MKLKSIRIQNVLGARAVDITIGCPVALIGLIAKGKVWKHVNRGTQQ